MENHHDALIILIFVDVLFVSRLCYVYLPTWTTGIKLSYHVG